MKFLYRRTKYFVFALLLVVLMNFVRPDRNEQGWLMNRGGEKVRNENIENVMIPSDWSVGSLRSRLLEEYEDVEKLEIPRRIWQSWRSKENLDKNFERNVQRWSGQKGFEYSFMDDEEVDNFVRKEFGKFPEIVQAWDVLPRKILKADFFRYLILLAKGGYYGDIDTSLSNDIENWLNEEPLRSLLDVHNTTIGAIVGIEDEADLGTWRGVLNRRVNFCQWAMASRPGHPIFVDIVARITDLALNYYDKSRNTVTFPKGYKNLVGIVLEYNMTKDSYNWYEGIIEWTGPAAFTDVFFHVINRWYLQNFNNNLPRNDEESFCNEANVCIFDPNRPLNLIKKLQNYPLGDNLLGISLPHSPIGWENFTYLEYPMVYGDVAILPKHFFNSLYVNDQKKGYVYHAFTGTWKWTQEP